MLGKCLRLMFVYVNYIDNQVNLILEFFGNKFTLEMTTKIFFSLKKKLKTLYIDLRTFFLIISTFLLKPTFCNGSTNLARETLYI